MRTSIDYGPETAQSRAKALADCRAYFGKQFNKIVEELREKPLNPRQFTIGLAFAGVEGFPVKVLYEHCYGEHTWVSPEEPLTHIVEV